MSNGAARQQPAIALENLSLSLGPFGLRGVSFALAPGEIGVILGPNGAGKSVALETVAGFHRPDAGRVIIGGRDVTALPPERRRVAFILQNFGLFPHLTAAENIAFGLHARGRTRSLPDIGALLARFHLEKVAQMRPGTLSPGEKQRVALARGLITDPDAFLLDEPFAALDTRTTDALREELRRFIHEANIPALFVTHDHIDALTLADKVAVMTQGRIVQTGTPAEVFNRPRNRFVAEFLGMENIFSATVIARQSRGWTVGVVGRPVCVAVADQPPQVGDAVLLCIRADAIDVRPSDEGPSGPTGRFERLTGRIVDMANIGSLVRVVVDCGFPLTAHLLRRTAEERGLRPDRPVVADVDIEAIHLIRAD